MEFRVKPVVSRLPLALLVAAPAALAAEATTRFADPSQAATRTVDSAGGFGQTLFGLIIVVAVIFVLALFAKRLRGLATGGANGIEVLGSSSLGSKERAVIVRVDGERLLLGVASGQVTLLKVLSALPEGDEPPAVGPTQVASFAALLRKSLGK
jgi:flagellar protein FliO/FliZ